MHGFQFSIFAGPGRRHSTVLLAAVWCLGLLAGIFLVSRASESVIALMRLAGKSRVSIVGLLLGNLLPFLLSFAAISSSMPRLVYAVCFFRSALYGFCAFGVGLGYGSAGWLVQALLLFSDVLTMPALFWFWIRHIGGRRRSRNRDFLLCVIYAVAVWAADFCLVAPFLARLLSFWKG